MRLLVKVLTATNTQAYHVQILNYSGKGFVVPAREVSFVLSISVPQKTGTYTNRKRT
jgi:hypothetical protein